MFENKSIITIDISKKEKPSTSSQENIYKRGVRSAQQTDKTNEDFEKLEKSFWDTAKDVAAHSSTILTIYKYAMDKKIEILEQTSILFRMRTFQLFKDILEDNHHVTLNILHWIAYILAKKGKYDQDVLCNRMDILGSNHPYMLNTMHDLATVFYEQGKYEGSSIRYQDWMWKLKNMLRPDYPDMLNTMDVLASVLKYAISLVHYQEILYKRKEILEPHQHDTPSTMKKLVSILDKHAKNDPSILYLHICYKQKSNLGPNHPHTLDTMHNLAVVFYKGGKLLICNHAILCKQKEVLGSDHTGR